MQSWLQFNLMPTTPRGRNNGCRSYHSSTYLARDPAMKTYQRHIIHQHNPHVRNPELHFMHVQTDTAFKASNITREQTSMMKQHYAFILRKKPAKQTAASAASQRFETKCSCWIEWTTDYPCFFCFRGSLRGRIIGEAWEASVHSTQRLPDQFQILLTAFIRDVGENNLNDFIAPRYHLELLNFQLSTCQP